MAETSTTHISTSLGLPKSPYPGIEPYRYRDRWLFFAREGETRALIQLIGLYRGVLLYSESGAGKSSLINAGLIPAAIQEGYQPERIRLLAKPDQEIVVQRIRETELDNAPFLPSLLAGDNSSTRVVLSLKQFADILQAHASCQKKSSLAASPGPASSFAPYGIPSPPKRPTVRPLLIFDQFEEWVTLFEDEANGESLQTVRKVQAQILAAITAVITNSNLAVKVLIALREDYLAKLTPLFQECPTLPDQYLRLAPLKGNQIQRIIRGPFQEYPKHYSPHILPEQAAAIQRDFERMNGGADIRLTEVQIVCHSLYEEGRRGQDIAPRLQTQGVRGILEHYLDQALAALPAEQHDAALALLTRMITARGTRKVVAETDLIDLCAADGIDRQLLLQTLLNLDRQTKLIRSEPRRDINYYEIASEFLVDWIGSKGRERERRMLQQKLQAEEHQSWERQHARMKQRMLVIGLVVVIVMLLGWVFFKREIQEAEEKLTKAEANTEKEEERADTLANSNKVLASNLSDAQALAKHTMLEKLAEASKATSNAVEKLRFEAEAEKVRNELLAAYQLKEQQANQIRGNQSALNEAKDTLNRLRSLALAQRLANQATQLKGELSGLLARQAYLFNEKGRSQAHTDVDNDIDHALRMFLSNSHGLPPIRTRSGVMSLACQTNQSLLAAGRDGIRSWRWDGTQGATIITNNASSIVCSPDGRSAAIWGADGVIQLVDLSRPELPGQFLTGNSDPVTALAFSANGRKLAAGNASGKVYVWDLSQGDGSPKVMDVSSNHILAVALNASGRWLAAGTVDRAVKLWDLEARPFRLNPFANTMITLPGHTGGCSSLAFSADGKFLATGAGDGKLRLWPLRLSRPEPEVMLDAGGPIIAMVFHPSRALLAASALDGTIRIWDYDQSNSIATVLRGHDNSVPALVSSADRKHLVSGSLDRTVRFWDWDSAMSSVSASVPTISIPQNVPVLSAAFSPDGAVMASGTFDGEVRIFDLWNRKALAGSLTGHKDRVLCVAWSPTNQYLASGSADGTLQVWDWRAKGAEARLRLLRGFENGASSAVFSHDAELLIAGAVNGGIRVWEWKTNTAATLFEHPRGGVRCVAISPDDRLVAGGGGDNIVRVWNIKRGYAAWQELKGHEENITTLSFSRDGRQLASGSGDGSVRLWNAQSLATPAVVLKLPSGGVTSLDFSPDGHWLAAGCRDGRIRMWSLNPTNPTDRIPRLLKGHTGAIFSVAFGSDGTLLRSVSLDQTMLSWIGSSREMAEQVCPRVSSRDLTQNEWEHYVGTDISYEPTCRPR